MSTGHDRRGGCWVRRCALVLLMAVHGCGGDEATRNGRTRRSLMLRAAVSALGRIRYPYQAFQGWRHGLTHNSEAGELLELSS